MILEWETYEKYQYYSTDISKFSKKMVIVKCDICGKIFESSNIRINMSLKNNKSELIICNNIDCIKRKREYTMVKLYGVPNIGLHEDHIDKVKKTNNIKYGCDWAMQNDNINILSKQKSFLKYGTYNPSKSFIIKNKIKNTNMERYGVEYPMQSDYFKIKNIQTNIHKYGVSHPNKLKEYKNKISKVKLSIELSKLKEKYNNFDFVFDESEYAGYRYIYKFRCKCCKNIFYSSIIGGIVCSFCNPSKRSNIEEEISDFLIENSINFKKNSKTVIFPFEIDFHLLDANIAIELNGNYWHSESRGKDKNYHLNKTKLCEKKNIQLIHVFEDEWIYKKHIIKNLILFKLNLLNTVDSINCRVENISEIDTINFLEQNSIVNSTIGNINIGLFYKDNLISIMSAQSDNHNLKIYDFLDILNINVIGSFSKFIEYIINMNKYNKITVIADRRFTFLNKNIYLLNGFKLLDELNPSFFYLDKNNYLNRNVNNTRYLNIGFDRIFDCGNLKYELKIK